MAITFRSVRSGFRLGVGGMLLPSALRRGLSMTEWELISVDIFGTLLARMADEHVAWHESALHAAAVARARGLESGIDPIATRRKVENRLGASRLAAAYDPEFPHLQVLEEMLREWGAGDWAPDAAAEVAGWELQCERRFTRPVHAMVEAVRQWASEGKRVVAISDTRYSAEELAWLLSSHGVSGLSAIYSSADESMSKFSGRLFKAVAERERVDARRVLHIGDDLYADALSAANRGLALRRVQRPADPPPLPVAPPQPDCADAAFAVGYQTLGPILVAFTRLLVDRARRDGMRHLAFVARDGELLLRVAQTLCEQQTSADLQMSYLHLSRRSLACASPDLLRLGTDTDAVQRVIATLRGIRGMGSVLQSFQSYYNAPAQAVQRHASRLHAQSGTEADVRRLLSDRGAAADLAEAFRPMRERVRRYLMQEDVLCEQTALVDIGWRGSLQTILQSESSAWGLAAPHGYYVGLWNEDSANFPVDATGLITDQRRGRGLLEGAAWHAAFLLEAVCRARHGIVAGFAEGEDGGIQPIHVESGGTRDAERESERTQVRIQSGVLAYAKWFVETSPMTVTDEAAIRREAQHRLMKLAFFPTANEREIGCLLVHSEPTSDGSALWLIANSGVGLKGWVTGLRSPWKGGYLRANGGAIASGIFCALEAVVSQLPGTKPAIRRLLIRD